MEIRGSTTETKNTDGSSGEAKVTKLTQSQDKKRRCEPLLGALKIGTTCDEFYLDRPLVVEDMARFFSGLTLSKISLTSMLDYVNHLATDRNW